VTVYGIVIALGYASGQVCLGGASTLRRGGTGSRFILWWSCCWPREAACLGLRGLLLRVIFRGGLRFLVLG
jgi:hypothetical protein